MLLMVGTKVEVASYVAILDILKIKDLKTTNRDRKKANKQDIRYYSIDSNGQDNNQLPTCHYYNHLSYKSLF